MPDFRQLLSKPLDSVTRPPVLPNGTYYGTIMSFKIDEARFANDDGSKNVIVAFTVKPSHAGPDVDADELAAAEAAKALGDRLQTVEMPLTGGNEWATKMFLDAIGISTAGKTWDTCLPETRNAQVMFEITKRIDKNNPEVWHNNARKLRAAA